jgi:DNA replication protein DnaC
VLVGRNCTGKTHLLAATFNALMSSGHLPLYVLVSGLLDHVCDGYQADNYGRRFAPMRSAPSLLLDDLGAERRTEWTDQTLFMLLGHRYCHELPHCAGHQCRARQSGGAHRLPVAGCGPQ